MLYDTYEVKQIQNKVAQKMVIDNHYLHRKASCSFAYGLIDKHSGKLVGTIMYGLPASPNVCRGICGEEEIKSVIELTRLWIEDGTPKNVESFLIGQTLNIIKNETNYDIVISYAERDVGHRGTIYQATNFIYCGLTEKRTNRVKADGTKTNHNRHACMDKNDTILVERPRKHRYVYFTCNRRRKKELLSKLRYDIKPYPKQ